MDWVSINNELPDEEGYYLVYLDIGYQYVAKYEPDLKWFTNYQYTDIPVTHWMHLPKPPIRKNHGR